MARHSAEQIEAVRTMYERIEAGGEASYSLDHIAEVTGVPRRTIEENAVRHRWKRGTPPVRRKYDPLPMDRALAVAQHDLGNLSNPVVRDVIQRLVADGVPIAVAARVVGVRQADVDAEIRKRTNFGLTIDALRANFLADTFQRVVSLAREENDIQALMKLLMTSKDLEGEFTKKQQATPQVAVQVNWSRDAPTAKVIDVPSEPQLLEDKNASKDEED